jgi:hypothetical protein
MWVDEGESITFKGNSSNGGTLPFKFTAFEHTEPFSEEIGIWGLPVRELN